MGKSLRKDVDLEKNRLMREKLSLSELHGLSLKEALKIVDSNPESFRKEAKKSYVLAAVNELIYETKIKRSNEKYKH